MIAYFVNLASGNDANGGSNPAGDAFKTLAKAAAVAAVGDTITVVCDDATQNPFTFTAPYACVAKCWASGQSGSHSPSAGGRGGDFVRKALTAQTLNVQVADDGLNMALSRVSDTGNNILCCAKNSAYGANSNIGDVVHLGGVGGTATGGGGAGSAGNGSPGGSDINAIGGAPGASDGQAGENPTNNGFGGSNDVTKNTSPGGGVGGDPNNYGRGSVWVTWTVPYPTITNTVPSGLLGGGLSGGLLGGPAADMVAALPDVVNVIRANVTQGTAGGTFYDFGTTNATIVASGIACNIQNVKPAEIQMFARRGIKVSNKIFFAQNLGLKLGDRIQDPNNLARYFVVTFLADMAGQHLAFKAYVNLIQ